MQAHRNNQMHRYSQTTHNSPPPPDTHIGSSESYG